MTISTDPNAPPRYIDEEGNIHYRASAIGMCDKLFVALALGYEPREHPEWFQEVLNEGHQYEQTIIDQYTTREDAMVRSVVDRQGEFSLMILPGIFISGHIDGEDFAGDIIRGVEVKKIRDGMWAKFNREKSEYLPFYPWQLSAYWFGRGWMDCVMIGGRLKDGVIVETTAHYLTEPPIPLKALKLRIMMLETKINDATHPDQVPCQIKQYPCPVFYLHDADDKFQPPVKLSDDILDTLLDQLATEEEHYLQLKKVYTSCEERYKALKGGVGAWLRANGVDDDEAQRVTLTDGREFEVKVKLVTRAGYEVKPTEFDMVTVGAIGDDGKKVPKPRAPRKPKAPTEKTSTEKAGGESIGLELGGDEMPTETPVQPPVPSPVVVSPVHSDDDAGYSHSDDPVPTSQASQVGRQLPPRPPRKGK